MTTLQEKTQNNPPSHEGAPKTPENTTQWYVYLLRCNDNSLYCGVTTNPTRRTVEHNNCNKKAAKYTRARRPVSLVYQKLCNNKVAAYQQEYQLKRLSKKQKERLITG